MMFFASLFFQAICETGREFTTARKMTFRQGNKLLGTPGADGWYFADFKNRPQLEELRKMNIDVTSESIMMGNLMKLFLTREQAMTLTATNTVDLFAVPATLKIDDVCVSQSGSLLAANTSVYEGVRFFDVECRAGFNLHVDGYTVREAGRGHFHVGIRGSDSDILAKIRAISEIPEVFWITNYHRVTPRNRWTAPFVQSWSNQWTTVIDTTRDMEEKGLTGAGVTVLVSDTGLDADHTFFYDSEHPDIEVDKVIEGHRKIAYYSSASGTLDTDGHGTHVAGTLAGNAVCTGCPEQYYSGIAKDAKLGIFNSIGGSEQKTDAESHLNIMKSIDATISSNSWGTTIGSDFLLRNEYDRAMYDSGDHLFVFATGNEGGPTVQSPATAKNVLSVGGLSMLTQSAVETTQEIIVTVGGQSQKKGLELVLENNGPYGAGVSLGELGLVVYDRETIVNTMYQWTTREETKSVLVASWDGDVTYLTTLWNLVRPLMSPTVRFQIFFVQQTAEEIQAAGGELQFGFAAMASTTPSMATTSAAGSTTTGILKPEVVAPSEGIKSARAWSEQTEKGHLGLSQMTGTSMSAPLVSGALALIEQYFRDGYYCTHEKNTECAMKPGNCLLRAMIVASADPVESAYTELEEMGISTKKPIGTSGFGSVNLERVLPLASSTDDFSLRVAENVAIQDGEHFVAKVTCTGTTRDMRIVMTYLDPPLAVDSYASLAVDLDLLVIGPDKKVFLGNHNSGNTSEHFSTVERVIINSDELVTGEYTIHIYSHDPYKLGCKFSVVCIGPNEGNERLSFTSATSSDIVCTNGGNATPVGSCECPSGYWGPVCEATILTSPSDAYVPLPQNDPIRFSFEVPTSEATSYLDIANMLQTGKTNRHILYLTTQNHDATSPIDFETIVPYNQQLNMKVASGARLTGMVVNLDAENDVVQIRLRSDNSSPLTPIQQQSGDEDDDSNDGKTMSMGAGVAGWVIAAVVIVALVAILILVFVCKKGSSGRYSSADEPAETANP